MTHDPIDWKGQYTRATTGSVNELDVSIVSAVDVPDDTLDVVYEGVKEGLLYIHDNSSIDKVTVAKGASTYDPSSSVCSNKDAVIPDIAEYCRTRDVNKGDTHYVFLVNCTNMGGRSDSGGLAWHDDYETYGWLDVNGPWATKQLQAVVIQEALHGYISTWIPQVMDMVTTSPTLDDPVPDKFVEDLTEGDYPNEHTLGTTNRIRIPVYSHYYYDVYERTPMATTYDNAADRGNCASKDPDDDRWTVEVSDCTLAALEYTRNFWTNVETVQEFYQEIENALF